MATKRGHGEGSIYKRKDGRWCGSVMVEGKRTAVYAKTRREVASKLADVQRNIARGIALHTDRQALEDYLKFWLERVKKPTVRPSSYKAYRVAVHIHIIPAIGHIPLSKLTPQRVTDMLNGKLEEGVSPLGVRYLRLVLGMALKQAVEWEMIPRNVVTLTTAPKVTPKSRYLPTIEETRRLLSLALQTHEAALFSVALMLGLRMGELRALRWNDIDFARGVVRVEHTLVDTTRAVPVLTDPKTPASRRTIPMPPALIMELQSHWKQQQQERMKAGPNWHDYNLVFTMKNGESMLPKMIRVHLHALCVAAGLPHLRVHDLRHMCASLMARQKVPPKTAMEILGHGDMRSTQQIYTHVYQDEKRTAVESIADVMETPEETAADDFTVKFAV